jgi:hypothetical protein
LLAVSAVFRSTTPAGAAAILILENVATIPAGNRAVVCHSTLLRKDHAYATSATVQRVVIERENRRAALTPCNRARIPEPTASQIDADAACASVIILCVSPEAPGDIASINDVASRLEIDSGPASGCIARFAVARSAPR